MSSLPLSDHFWIGKCDKASEGICDNVKFFLIALQFYLLCGLHKHFNRINNGITKLNKCNNIKMNHILIAN